MLFPLPKLARPKQWAKNVFVLVGPLYALTDHKHTLGGVLPPALITAAILAVVSSACYVVNDILDAPRDRLHPRKSKRPIASGAVPPNVAWIYAVALVALGALGLLLLRDERARLWVAGFTLAYAVNTNLYSFYLKRKAIADVICLSLGFVIRVLAGCAAAGVQPSTWLLNCTLFLAMFLSFGKRLGERKTMGDDVGAIRGVQLTYTDDLLRTAVSVTGVATLITYAGYIQFRDAAHFWVNPLWLTMLPATYGLLRCIVLLERGKYDDPTEIAARDWAIQAAALVFGAITVGTVLASGGAH